MDLTVEEKFTNTDANPITDFIMLMAFSHLLSKNIHFGISVAQMYVASLQQNRVTEGQKTAMEQNPVFFYPQIFFFLNPWE